MDIQGNVSTEQSSYASSLYKMRSEDFYVNAEQVEWTGEEELAAASEVKNEPVNN